MVLYGTKEVKKMNEKEIDIQEKCRKLVDREVLR